MMRKTNRARVIFHVDMNSFYASVEIVHKPSLKGKPIAIAGNPQERRGIIVTSSYEARAKGVKTTMPIWEAKKLCPNLIIIPPNFDRYRETSKEIFQLLAELTPIIEPVSIDEGYMDVTDHPTNPVLLAEEIQATLLEKVGIPCSIGIGPNKFLAKTASDMKKPLGITILRIRELAQHLWPLPIDNMYGVGKKTAEKLRKLEIETIGDLAEADVYELNQLLGINGERLKNRANGIDPRLVDPDSVNDFKSIGNSTTLREDTTDIVKVKTTLEQLATRVEERMLRRKLVGRTVQLTLRYSDRKTITRSRKLTKYINKKATILRVIYELLDQHWQDEPLRLLGVTMQDLLEEKEVMQQLSLFTYHDEIKRSQYDHTVAELKSKFGEHTFRDVSRQKATAKDDASLLRTSFQKDFLDDYRTDSSRKR